MKQDIALHFANATIIIGLRLLCSFFALQPAMPVRYLVLPLLLYAFGWLLNSLFRSHFVATSIYTASICTMFAITQLGVGDAIASVGFFSNKGSATEYVKSCTPVILSEPGRGLRFCERQQPNNYSSLPIDIIFTDAPYLHEKALYPASERIELVELANQSNQSELFQYNKLMSLSSVRVNGKNLGNGFVVLVYDIAPR